MQVKLVIEYNGDLINLLNLFLAEVVAIPADRIKEIIKDCKLVGIATEGV